MRRPAAVLVAAVAIAICWMTAAAMTRVASQRDEPRARLEAATIGTRAAAPSAPSLSREVTGIVPPVAIAAALVLIGCLASCALIAPRFVRIGRASPPRAPPALRFA